MTIRPPPRHRQTTVVKRPATEAQQKLLNQYFRSPAHEHTAASIGVKISILRTMVRRGLLIETRPLSIAILARDEHTSKFRRAP